MVHLQSLGKVDIDPALANEILARALLFGNLGSFFRKELGQITAATETISYAGILAHLVEGSDHLAYSRARLATLGFMWNNKDALNVSSLIAMLEAMTGIGRGPSKKRCYENSSTHLILIRKFQTYLIMTSDDFLTPEESVLLFHTVLDSIVDADSLAANLVSVRYFAEWTLIRLLLKTKGKHPVYETLMRTLDDAHEAAVSSGVHGTSVSGTSFIVIYGQLGLLATSDSAKGHCDLEILDRCMDKIVPWAMSHNFAPRTYAQIYCSKLIQMIEAVMAEAGDALLQAQMLLEKYRVIKDSVFRILNRHHAVNRLHSKEDGTTKARKADKVMSDFYLVTFDAQECFNLANILYDFPRLCGLARSELVLKEAFESLEWLDGVLMPVKVCNPNSPINSDDHRFKDGCEDQGRCFCDQCRPCRTQSGADDSALPIGKFLSNTSKLVLHCLAIR